jgi:hypothetical protein
VKVILPLFQSRVAITSVVGISGVVIWPSGLLEGNILAIDILVHEDIEEVSSFVVVVSSSLDVPL